MAQYARPDSDITVGNWTDEGTSFNDGNLYTSIQEVTSDNDTSYINADDTATTCVIGLNSINAPGTGTITLHVYFRSSGTGGPEKLDIDLYEGTSLVQSWPNQTNRSGTYSDLNATVSNTITDYSDLRVHLGADSVGSGEWIRVTQVYLEAPDAAGTDTSDSTSAYLKGSQNTSDNQVAFLQGSQDAGDNQEAYWKHIL